jgi:hypothetical protein
MLVNLTSKRKASAFFIEVKGTPLHFIIDSSRKKNLISVEFLQRLDLWTTSHPQPYTIGWLCQGSGLHIIQ